MAKEQQLFSCKGEESNTEIVFPSIEQKLMEGSKIIHFEKISEDSKGNPIVLFLLEKTV